MRNRHSRMNEYIASSPSCSASGVDPTASAKSTVTVRRSPSDGRWRRIFSARWTGVTGERAGCASTAAGPRSGDPHSSQNLAPSRFSCPQPKHFTDQASPRTLPSVKTSGANPTLQWFRVEVLIRGVHADVGNLTTHASGARQVFVLPGGRIRLSAKGRHKKRGAGNGTGNGSDAQED